ncbi:MAG: CDP-diacylglycerol--glycerol-3-phosphate 3-phosphatidyltransferase [Lachnospiraceae bacterium]|nr:CDP-diacylglycerol--glycerol-3-phosphate 3-phosphatidyltransferase [Lachnospiraceae bacterium]
MNLPNKITCVRVILIPFFLLFLLVPTIPANRIIALVIFIIASLTDALDGHIARSRNLITDFGKFMDPLADKLLVCSALICFSYEHTLPVVVTIAIIAREFIISGFRQVAADRGIVIAASYWGKFKTTSQMILCVLLILHLDLGWWHILEQVFTWIALALTIISLVDYMVKNKDVILKGSM